MALQAQPQRTIGEHVEAFTRVTQKLQREKVPSRCGDVAQSFLRDDLGSVCTSVKLMQ